MRSVRGCRDSLLEQKSTERVVATVFHTRDVYDSGSLSDGSQLCTNKKGESLAKQGFIATSVGSACFVGRILVPDPLLRAEIGRERLRQNGEWSSKATNHRGHEDPM